MTPQPDERPPVMQAIADRRAQRGLSIRQAALLADMSEARWRQLERAYRATPIGRAPETASETNIARMACVTGLPADELRELGHPGAAKLLEERAGEWRDHADAVVAGAAARDAARAAARLMGSLSPRQRAALEAKFADDLRELREPGENNQDTS